METEFMTRETLNPQLLFLPYLTPEFKAELASQDIYTTYQLVGQFAKFHFDYEISSKLFQNMDERCLYILFTKLSKMGFEIVLPACEPSDLKVCYTQNDEYAQNDEYTQSDYDYSSLSEDDARKMITYYTEQGYM